MILSSSHHRLCFESLTDLLRDFRAVWTESPFLLDQLSWCERSPELHRDLLNLSDEKLEELNDEQGLLAYLTSFIPALAEVRELRIEHLETTDWEPSKKATFGVPGRKQAQISGFVSALKASLGDERPDGIVDWCSGQGYLARQLYYALDCPVHCLEYDTKLCQKGAENHEKLDPGLAHRVTFRVQDVLCRLHSRPFKESALHTALHACGDLHLSMLRQGVEKQIEMIACSPCCYHLIDDQVYKGLSGAAKDAQLSPTKNHLRLATAELSTASTAERSLRQRELLWRIAFDLRFREVSGVDRYRPTPSVKKSLLKRRFQDYAVWMTHRIQGPPELSTFSQTKESELLELAMKKLQRVKRLEKAQLGFRKALELWLLLDRVLYLEENGYQARLLEFCDKQDSGRNVMIVASRTLAPSLSKVD